MPDSLLLKFQKLPDAAKANASDPAAMRALDGLEKDYGVNLAELVMRVMVQEVEPAKLDEVLEQQYAVPATKSKELAKHLLDDIFFKFRLLDIPDVKDVLTAEAPKPQLVPQPGASPFLVHPDDHKDIAPHVTALQTAPPAPIDTDPQHVATKLAQMEKLALDDMLTKRFTKIVEARLVDVRDTMETASMLQRPQKIGGMGLEEAQASRIVNELERVVEEVHRRPKVVVKAPPPPPKPVPTPPAPISKPVVAPLPSPPLDGGKGLVQKPPLPLGEDARRASEGKLKTAPPPAPAAKPIVAPPPWLRPVQAPTPVVRPATAPVARPAAPRPTPPPTRPAPSYREMVTDVRAPAKVMGPIEVLGNLSLEDFRRLGQTAADRTAKIAEEIETLSRDSFAQRAAGIAAFRQSPTFKAYLTLGQMAMERKEEVVEIIDLLKAQNTASLTPEEFEAIGVLMRQFRY